MEVTLDFHLRLKLTIRKPKKKHGLNCGSCWFFRFLEWGFEKGWGDTAGRVKETIHSLSEVLQAPDPLNMEKFFSRVPTIFNIVIFSPHGYFGQADVLGLPDTGGQV